MPTEEEKSGEPDIAKISATFDKTELLLFRHINNLFLWILLLS